jgi:hypothetical protein
MKLLKSLYPIPALELQKRIRREYLVDFSEWIRLGQEKREEAASALAFASGSSKLTKVK